MQNHIITFAAAFLPRDLRYDLLPGGLSNQSQNELQLQIFLSKVQKFDLNKKLQHDQVISVTRSL